MTNKPNSAESSEKSGKKRLLLLLILLLAVIVTCGIVLGITFARYKTDSNSADKSVPVAKWGVTTDVTGTLQTVANDNVVNGKLAPASEAYIDIVIDLSGTEVAVDYSLTIGELKAPEGKTIPAGFDAITVDRIVTRVGNADGAALTLESGKYVRTVELPVTGGNKTAFAANTKETVRIYFTWENDDTDAANALDTTVGTTLTQLVIPVTVDAVQHIDAA